MIRRQHFLNGLDGTMSIPDQIKIALEGDGIHSLVALIGNNVCQITPWAKVIVKLNGSLAKREQSKPTKG